VIFPAFSQCSNLPQRRVDEDAGRCVFLGFEPGKASRRTSAERQEVAMQIDKQEVVDLLRKEGKNEHVQKALQELPDKIDHEQHAQMLQQKFGIDPGKLAEKAIEKELR